MKINYIQHIFRTCCSYFRQSVDLLSLYFPYSFNCTYLVSSYGVLHTQYSFSFFFDPVVLRCFFCFTTTFEAAGGLIALEVSTATAEDLRFWLPLTSSCLLRSAFVLAANSRATSFCKRKKIQWNITIRNYRKDKCDILKMPFKLFFATIQVRPIWKMVPNTTVNYYLLAKRLKHIIPHTHFWFIYLFNLGSTSTYLPRSLRDGTSGERDRKLAGTTFYPWHYHDILLTRLSKNTWKNSITMSA